LARKPTLHPFFEKYPLMSRKRVDFIKFRDIVILMSHGAHLTVEGVANIRTITEEMNRKGLRIRGCHGWGTS
jgi:hypothetical protein